MTERPKGLIARWWEREGERGPSGPLARYAFGYSDQKPGIWYWIMMLGMILYIVYHMFRISSNG